MSEVKLSERFAAAFDPNNKYSFPDLMTLLRNEHDAILSALRLAESPSVAEAVEREPCQICQDILLIEESRQAGDSTPGGFEHMGDVWRQITEWAAAIRNRKE